MAATTVAAEWKTLVLKALQKNRSVANARYMQIATVRPDGRPANRTVVFRGFLEDSNMVTFITDARSSKVEEIKSNPLAEICWYLPNTREQFRLSGRLSLVGQEPDAPPHMAQGRTKVWVGMSDPARAQFMWPDPGLPRTLPLEAWDGVVPPTPDSIPPDTFLLVAMEVATVDHLLLKANQRFVYARSAQADVTAAVADSSVWDKVEVNP